MLGLGECSVVQLTYLMKYSKLYMLLDVNKTYYNITTRHDAFVFKILIQQAVNNNINSSRYFYN